MSKKGRKPSSEFKFKVALESFIICREPGSSKKREYCRRDPEQIIEDCLKGLKSISERIIKDSPACGYRQKGIV